MRISDILTLFREPSKNKSDFLKYGLNFNIKLLFFIDLEYDFIMHSLIVFSLFLNKIVSLCGLINQNLKTLRFWRHCNLEKQMTTVNLSLYLP